MFHYLHSIFLGLWLISTTVMFIKPSSLFIVIIIRRGSYTKYLKEILSCSYLPVTSTLTHLSTEPHASSLSADSNLVNARVSLHSKMFVPLRSTSPFLVTTIQYKLPTYKSTINNDKANFEVG